MHDRVFTSGRHGHRGVPFTDELSVAADALLQRLSYRRRALGAATSTRGAQRTELLLLTLRESSGAGGLVSAQYRSAAGREDDID